MYKLPHKVDHGSKKWSTISLQSFLYYVAQLGQEDYNKKRAWERMGRQSGSITIAWESMRNEGVRPSFYSWGGPPTPWRSTAENRSRSRLNFHH